MTGTLATCRHSLLLVDDSTENLAVLNAFLRADYQIRIATSGELALRLASSHPRPDLILLDILMPGIDGYEVLRRLKDSETTRDIPVIFVTSLTEAAEEVQGFELGAVDYITKPFNAATVLARIRTQLALRETRAELEACNRHLRHERDLIEVILERLRGNANFDARHTRYLLSSVDRSNGDLFLSAFTPDGRQRILVGDIAGHGPSAAICAPLVCHVFYRHARADGTVEELFHEINEVMYRELPVNMFMAACLIEISADRRRVRLWNGGLPGCLLRRRDGSLEHFASRNFPFGLRPAVAAEDGREERRLAPGDRLYLFSDGLSEAEDADGRVFGIDRGAAFIAELAEDAPLDGIRALLAAHCRNASLHDDVTVVEISV